MGRITAAVITGYLTIGLLVLLTDQIAAWTIPGFTSMSTPPPNYFYSSVVTDSFYAFIGGYLCAKIAHERSWSATVALIIFGETIGLVSQIALWSTVPHWFGLALLASYPIAVWLGSRLKGAVR
jgi:hypothetical protein